jgi:Flp pilus assembly protein TadG
MCLEGDFKNRMSEMGDPEAESAAALAAYYRSVVEVAATYARHAGRERIHSADMKRANNSRFNACSDMAEMMALYQAATSATTAPSDPQADMPFVRSDAAWTTSSCPCPTCVGANDAAPAPPMTGFALVPMLWSAVDREIAKLRNHKRTGSRAIVLDN